MLSIYQCLYGRCLLLSLSSYLVMLPPPPMVVSLVPLLGQCGLLYFVHCRIARCRIILFVLWYYRDHRFSILLIHDISSSSFCVLGNSGSLMSWSFLVWSIGCMSWCPFIFYCWWSFSSFRHQGWCVLLIALATVDAFCCIYSWWPDSWS